jgi:putative acetyltransferase
VSVAGEIAREDARREDVRQLLERHLGFARHHSPPQDAHALEIEDPARS